MFYKLTEEKLRNIIRKQLIEYFSINEKNNSKNQKSEVYKAINLHKLYLLGDKAGIKFDINNYNLNFLENSNLSGVDLSGAILTNANLNNSNLSYAKFSDTQLNGANLSNCLLTNSKFYFMELHNTKFIESNLSESFFRSVFFNNVDFSKANLYYCNFKNVNINKPNFSECQMDEETKKFLKTKINEFSKKIDF